MTVHGNSKYHQILTKKFLKEKYYIVGVKNLTKEIGCDRTTIYRYIKKYKLPSIKISIEGSKIKAKKLSQNRKKGIVKTWNKNKKMWIERPDLVMKMKQTQIKNKKSKGTFKKGQNLSLPKRGILINKHHLDLNSRNNHPDNLLYLTNSKHNSLHKRAYDFVLEKGLIKDYIRWFSKHFKPTFYSEKEYKNINKKITRRIRSGK